MKKPRHHGLTNRPWRGPTWSQFVNACRRRALTDKAPVKFQGFSISAITMDEIEKSSRAFGHIHDAYWAQKAFESATKTLRPIWPPMGNSASVVGIPALPPDPVLAPFLKAREALQGHAIPKDTEAMLFVEHPSGATSQVVLKKKGYEVFHGLASWTHEPDNPFCRCNECEFARGMNECDDEEEE